MENKELKEIGLEPIEITDLDKIYFLLRRIERLERFKQKFERYLIGLVSFCVGSSIVLVVKSLLNS